MKLEDAKKGLVIGDHVYLPAVRFDARVDELKEILLGTGVIEEVAREFLKQMLHLCVAYLIGAEKNDVPNQSFAVYSHCVNEVVPNATMAVTERGRNLLSGEGLNGEGPFTVSVILDLYYTDLLDLADVMKSEQGLFYSDLLQEYLTYLFPVEEE